MRILSLFLVALALMLSPIGMAGGMGIAQAQSIATADMAGHCAGMDAPGDSESPVEQIDCMSVCSAVAPAQAAMPSRPPVVRIANMAVPAPVLTGSPPERETPPPRLS